MVNEFKIGPLIRAWRKKRNMIQKELAAAVKMDVTQMWSIENDRNSPSLRTVARIAAALQVSVPELMSSPPESTVSVPPSSSEDKGIMSRPFNMICAGETNLFRLVRDNGRKCALSEDDLQKLEKSAGDAISLERRFQTLIPIALPLSIPIVKSEAGARQLAAAVRSHCNVGSAIIHDVLALFETYGVRILEAPLPKGAESVAFYSPEHRNITIFLAERLKEVRWRRQFVFLSEIGRAFLFADNGFRTYRESARSRRFAHHFAAAFLLPELTVVTLVNSLHVRPNDWTWKLLLRLRARLGVSAHMFNIRLKELNLISRKKYATFNRKIKTYYNGESKKEPDEPSDEITYRRGDLLALHP